MESAEFTRIVRRRRSIKPAQFSSRRIDDTVIEELLENANWAPTHGMTEPWRFFVFSDAARIRLGQELARIYEEITPADAQKPGKAEKLIQSCRQSSHVIAIGMKRQPSHRIPEVEEIEAVACAVQNLHLTATAYQLAGYWSSGGAICSEQFRDHLRLDAEDRVLGLFYLGYTDMEWPEGRRTPIQQKVHWFRN